MPRARSGISVATTRRAHLLDAGLTGTIIQAVAAYQTRQYMFLGTGVRCHRTASKNPHKSVVGRPETSQACSAEVCQGD